MSDMCDDNRFELIEKYKKELIEATNIETAPDEMAVLDDILYRFWQMGWLDKLELPPAQPERLTDDDFETIRIHLNAHKEKLCNQRRWKEAKEYQRIIDRFMAFASTQPEERTEERTETHACDCISRQDVLGWLLAYHTKSFDLKGRYYPHEVIGWLVTDISKNLFADMRGEQE